VVGIVTFRTGGTVVFEAPVAAARLVYERTFDSDMDYHLAAFFGSIFTRRALPYWFGVVGTVVGMVGIILAITATRRAEKRRMFGRY
jgi:hypothetical protein